MELWSSQFKIKERKGGREKCCFKCYFNSRKKACEKAGIKPSDLDIIIPHQANVRIIDTAIKRLSVLKERAYVNIENTGNKSLACIPVFKQNFLKVEG